MVHGLLDLVKRIQDEHTGTQLLFPQQLFFSIYDLNTLEPKPDYKAACVNAIRLMKEAGLPLSDALSMD